MKTLLKWAGILFGALAGLIVISLILIYFKSQSRLTHRYDVADEPIAIPMDAVSLERGNISSSSAAAKPVIVEGDRSLTWRMRT